MQGKIDQRHKTGVTQINQDTTTLTNPSYYHAPIEIFPILAIGYPLKPLAVAYVGRL